jgi:hypothetical protein
MGGSTTVVDALTARDIRLASFAAFIPGLLRSSFQEAQ